MIRRRRRARFGPSRRTGIIFVTEEANRLGFSLETALTRIRQMIRAAATDNGPER